MKDKVKIKAVVVDEKEVKGEVFYLVKLESRTNPIWVHESEIVAE